jgi:leucyl aminopeptidase (aminopeptidase T)
VREMARLSKPGPEGRDLAAFIAMALAAIAAGIDSTVAAWEKRDYWVKADKFRMEWRWAGETADKMKRAVRSDDWRSIALLSAQIAQKLNKISVSEHHRLGKPWVGAWDKLRSSQSQ